MELDSCSGRPSQQHLCLAMSSLVSRILKNVKMIGDFSWKLTYISHLTPSVRGLKPQASSHVALAGSPSPLRTVPMKSHSQAPDPSSTIGSGTFGTCKRSWRLMTQIWGSPLILCAPHVNKKWRSLKSMNPCNPKDATYYMYIIIL